jgi:hypothetical protein
VTTYTSWLRVKTAFALATGIGLVVVGALSGCGTSDMGNEPLLQWEDAGVDTCEASGGKCTARPVIEFFGPCGPMENEAPNLMCPTPSFSLTTLACCTPKRRCEGGDRGTCDYEGPCDGEVIAVRFCANGKSCCARSTASGSGGVSPGRDAGEANDASFDASSDGGD